MDRIIVSIIGAFEIAMLDLALCGDNIGVIALATRRLPKKTAKLASLLGIAGAVILRIIFACGITFILSISWLPIKLVGGLFLINVTWNFIRPHSLEEHNVRNVGRLWDSILAIIIADISMSLDNVLAVAGAADGNIILLVFGIMLNIPIIFFGSKFVADLMKKYDIIIYISGAILAHTSIKMILEDEMLSKYLSFSHDFIITLPWVAAVLALTYGIYLTEKEKNQINQRFRKIS